MNSITREQAATDEADDLLGVVGSIEKTRIRAPEGTYQPKNITEERALKLLGDSNLNPTIVANALGVTVARISQLLAEDDFAQEVSRRRFASLQSHNDRDAKIDKVEDKLLDRMEKLLPTLYKPGDVLKAFQIFNQAKRRGTTDPNSGAIAQTVVPLQLPSTVIQNYQVKVDINNNVISAGEQSMLTASLGDVAKLAAASMSSGMANVNEALGYDYDNGKQITEAVSSAARNKSEADFAGQELSENDI